MNYAFGPDSDDKECENSLLSLETKLPRWKKSVFKLLSSLLQHQLPSISSLYLLLFYLQNFIVLIQIASIIWTHNLSIQGWEDYKTIWKIFEYSRLDIVCVEADLIKNCIYGAYSFYLCLIILLLILYSYSVLKKSAPKNITLLTSKLLILANIGNNSLFLLLIMALKYSWQKTTPYEYTKTTSLDLGTFGIIMCILSLVILTFICYYNTVFTYDCKHVNANNSLYGKTISKINKIAILTNYLSIILYCLIPSNNFLVYRGLLMIFHSLSAGMYCSYLPFYNMKANFIHSAIHVFAVVSCFLNIIGYFIDSVIFCLLGLVILFPISITMWYFFMKYRISKIRIIDVNNVEDIKDFELVMRERLINPKPETADDTLKYFSEFSRKYSVSKPKILLVWLASFCFYACMNEKLAVLKLNPKSKVKSSLEEDFQEYILKKEIMKTLSQSEEYQLISKLSKFEKLKKIDKKTLVTAFTFLKNIVLKGPIQSNLESLMKKFQKNLKKLMKLNAKLSLRYQDSIMLLEFYANFIDHILGDRERAFGLNSRKSNLNKYQKYKDGKQSPAFSEENPMILVENTGKIIYSNTHIQKLFKVSSVYFSERYIYTLFPESIHLFSHEQLKSFEDKTLNSIKYLDANIGLIDSKGYWIETSVVALLVLLSHPVYMFVFKPLNMQRQSVIVDKKGIILERTEGFAEFIGNNIDVRGFSIEKLLKIKFSYLKINKVTEITVKNVIVFVMYNKTKVNNVLVRIISLHKSEESYKESTKNMNVKFISNIEYRTKVRKSTVSENKSINKTNEETMLFDMKLDNDKSTSNSHSIIPLKKINLLSNQCKRSIRFFKITLILSIIVVILTNISFLIFAKLSIEKELSQNALDILGQTMYIITSLGDISSMIQVFIPRNLLGIPSCMIFFNQTYIQLKNITHYYEHNTDMWTHCLDTKVLFSSNIPIASVKNNTYTYEYMTMYDFLQETLIRAEHFINEITAETYDINEDVLFLEFNAFGKASKYIQNELQNIVTCEKTSISKLIETKKILIGFGIGMLAVCGGMLLPFIFYTQRKLNLLWNQVKKAAIEDSTTFRELCVERLESTHNSLNYIIGATTQNQRNRVVYFSYQYKYLWRLLLLIIFGSCYYLISNYYFYDNFQLFLYKKPDVIYNLIFARTRTTSLNFIIKNYGVQQWYMDPRFKSPNFVPITTDYTTDLIITSRELIKNLNTFVKPGLDDLRSNSLFNVFFQQVQSSSGIMRTGIYAGILNTIIESFYIAYSLDPLVYQLVAVYYENIVQIGYQIEDTLKEAQSWMKTLVRQYLNMYLIFAVAFSVILLVIYAVLYYPFLYMQEKKVKALEYVAEIVISSNTANSNKANLLVNVKV
ncbi:hypothetical protein SteCoe_5538 [Stentor coeruleus]|uniref:Uncharacterized protein n=1 Tax=Stentor coeruleus TaxID=5963 RepID=A0A1R2CS82_9CILI|nr:hypothetical protein SteCoe_5538 [Stentor coeruleus]